MTDPEPPAPDDRPAAEVAGTVDGPDAPARGRTADATDPGEAPADHEPDEDRPGETGPTVAHLDEDELAIANAVALLSGPGLVAPVPRPGPEELEAGWGEAATAGLARLLEDLDDRRVGLAISGGGSLGSFEAGVLRFLYDHARIRPVAICGNSAGALNAAKLAEGEPAGGPRPVEEVERLWRSMRVNPDMWEPEPWVVRLMASASWASSIRGQLAGANGNAANAVRIAAKVVGGLVRRPPETDGTLEAIRDAVEAQSLLSLAPVAAIIERELRAEVVAASGIALRLGTVALESGELRYVTETGALHDREDRPLDQPEVPLAQGILASASIPVAFPPVLLNDEHYVDGGAREILPLEMLVRHLDVERAFAISAGTNRIERAPSFADRNLLDIMRRVSAEIATNETLRKELSPPGGWPDGVRLIVPDLDVHDAMTIDPALIAIAIDYGWLRAADALLGLDDEARSLSSALTRTRLALRERAGPVPSWLGGGEPLRPATPAEPEPADRTGAGWVDGEATLTARLREQVEARRALGAPLPPTLLAWLDAS